MAARKFLDGQLLIAMPGMSDPRFERSIVYMCAHSESGAMGLIVNKVTPMMDFADLASRLDIFPTGESIRIPDEVLHMPVQFGGPVEPGRGFVLHTTDYFSAESSLPVTERIALTATLEILRAMVGGQGPERCLLALGYAGWAPGQLEDEIQRNGWLNCAADDDILFGPAQEEKYLFALRKIGVDPAMLSTDAGHG